jgi:predicted small secreted protein
MKKFLLLLPIISIVLGLAACSTVQGAGKDIEDTGEWVQDKAEDAE